MKGEGNIKVFCRFRPFNGKELAANPTRIHRIQNNSQLIIKDSKQEDTSFLYDFVFDMDSTQDEVFEKVGQPVLNNILDGFHGTIMAYGQTSSGKTHTMQGYDLNEKDNRGLMPRIVMKYITRLNSYLLRSKNLQKTWSSNSKSPSFSFIWRKFETYWTFLNQILKSEREKMADL